ncbi:unnamed protein product, partial [Prorocentrum cordatum]
ERPLASVRSSPSPCSEDVTIQPFRADSPASEIANNLAMGAISAAILSDLGEQADTEGVVVEISEADADDEAPLAEEIRALISSPGDSLLHSSLGSFPETVNSQGRSVLESDSVAQDLLEPPDSPRHTGQLSSAVTLGSEETSALEGDEAIQERLAAMIQDSVAASDSPHHELPGRPDSVMGSHEDSVRGCEAGSVAMDSEAGPAAEAASLTAALADAVF